MATIAEIKDALADERQTAFEMTERAFDAIDRVSSAGSFYLNAFGIVIALLALVGFAVLYIGAKRVAKDVAQRRINSYLESEEGQKFIRKALEAEVKSQLENRIFTAVVPPTPPPNEGAFTKDPKEKGAGDAT